MKCENVECTRRHGNRGREADMCPAHIARRRLYKQKWRALNYGRNREIQLGADMRYDLTAKGILRRVRANANKRIGVFSYL